MSIYEVAMRMLGSDSRKLLGLITASLVLARLGKPCATRSGGPLRFYASKGMLQRKQIRE